MMTERISLLADLRAATRDGHQRAESLVGLPQSLPAHIHTLRMFYGFIKPWEAKAAPLLVPIADSVKGRWKTSLLLEDLKNLGISGIAIESIPQCLHLPAIDDVPTALGSMYVFEGSTLGGQILSRHIEKHLGLQNGLGYSFYRSYGSRVGTMWREYGDLVTLHTSTQSAPAVIQSACDTFDRLCNWFESQSLT